MIKLLVTALIVLVFSTKADCPKINPADSARFIKHTIWKDFISEGVAVADVNRDGLIDILAGAYWFEAPSWKAHELAKPVHYEPATGYSNSFLDFASDINQDGWIDLIRISLPGEEAVW
jgi:hypothetical protein